MIILFLVIAYRAPITPWGDVTQAVIYHQVIFKKSFPLY